MDSRSVLSDLRSVFIHSRSEERASRGELVLGRSPATAHATTVYDHESAAVCYNNCAAGPTPSTT